MAMDQDGSWLSGLSARKSIDKSLLKNIIRHTDAHNKIQEQNEMWKQWGLKKQARERDLSYKHDGNIRGYMRSDSGLSSAKKKESLKWNRLLLEYEETRKDRWGHSGYKELYPDEFQHDGHDSEIDTNESEDSEKVTVKTESPSREKTSKKAKKEKTKKSRKPTSDSDESDVEMTFNRRKANRKAKEVDDKKTHGKRKIVQSKESNFNRGEREKSRKSKYDELDNENETDGKSKKTNGKSKDLHNREMERKVKLNKESKTKRSENHGETSREYINNERKEKKKSYGNLRNDGRNKTRSTEISDSDESVKKRGDRKRNRDDALRTCTRADGKTSSKKKTKMRH
ncbi:uncharacterized protein NKAPD1-like [Dendronephthya gigantea]|uniref:uncharacterized protein NKAPD1-like n=1 Tax=Dendronephthya gigantea TaxID=151771 RepID=UPI0010691AF5|nr:uncharacterized protein NKAPD1-like [Dendronephthya gigantea]